MRPRGSQCIVLWSLLAALAACNPQQAVLPGAAGPDPFAPMRVVDWGPRGTQAGMPFNVQPDGSSGVYVRLADPAPAGGVEVLYAGQPLPGAAASGTLVTATLPGDRLSRPGHFVLAVRNRQTGQTTRAGQFTVAPAPGAAPR